MKKIKAVFSKKNRERILIILLVTTQALSMYRICFGSDRYTHQMWGHWLNGLGFGISCCAILMWWFLLRKTKREFEAVQIVEEYLKQCAAKDAKEFNAK